MISVLLYCAVVECFHQQLKKSLRPLLFNYYCFLLFYEGVEIP